MKVKFGVWVMMILLFSPLVIFADVTAYYSGESPISFDIAPGPFTHPSVLGAKLGTFTVTSSTGELYSPSLVNIGEASGKILVAGLMKEWDAGPYEMASNDFYIIAAAYPDGLGSNPILHVLYNNVIPLITWDKNTVYADPFYVELYLVNTNSTNPYSQSGWRPAEYFKEDTPYQLPAGFNPRFSVAVAENPNTNVGTYTKNDGSVKDSLGDYVPSNTGSGPDNTPILDPRNFNPENPSVPEFYYGDSPLLPSFFFAFETTQASFSLASAISSPQVINQAKITVINGEENTEYEQVLTFTDSSPTYPDFRLLAESGGAQAIDFQLYLDNELISKGVSTPWDGLLPGENTKDLKIGGISESAVALLPSGTYSTTIYVEISNPN
ncbi:MAG: hypothetical protein AB7D92_07100 [Sphaerochaeta sp.]